MTSSNRFWMNRTALQPLEIERFKTRDLLWTYVALGYFAATLARTPFLLELMTLVSSYPWPIRLIRSIRSDVLKPHSWSARNNKFFSDFIFTAEISHTYTELFSCRIILSFIGHYTPIFWYWCLETVSNKLSHKLNILFWILGDVQLALPEARSNWFLSSGSYLDFQSINKENFPSSLLLERSQLPLNGMSLFPNAMTLSIRKLSLIS